jgi:hypothetical protein
VTPDEGRALHLRRTGDAWTEFEANPVPDPHSSFDRLRHESAIFELRRAFRPQPRVAFSFDPASATRLKVDCLGRLQAMGRAYAPSMAKQVEKP